jgi:hypothetical protein
MVVLDFIGLNGNSLLSSSVGVNFEQKEGLR